MLNMRNIILDIYSLLGIKYGENSFEFKILYPVIDKNDLIKYEQVFMDEFKSYNDSSDIIYVQKLECFGIKHSEESKRKMSKVRLGKKLSTETIKKMSENNTGENNPFYGKVHSKEAKLKMSKDRRGKTIKKKLRKKISKSLIGKQKVRFFLKKQNKRYL